MKYRIQLRKDWIYSEYWWVLKSAGNGAVLATSEMYRTKRAAIKGAQDLAGALGIEVEIR